MNARRRMPARPRELLEAALAVFVEKGFDAARAEDIAARAGVSKGTLYLYFRGKEHMLNTLIDQRFSHRVVVHAHETAADGRTSRDLLREAMTKWWSSLAEVGAGGIFKLVVAEAHSFPGLAEFWESDVIGPARRLVSAIVTRGIARGEFRPVDAEVVAHSLALPMVMACTQRHAISPFAPGDSLMNRPDLFNEHIELVLEGLASHTPQPRLQGEQHVRERR